MRNKKVLRLGIVEDDPIVANFMALVAQKLGFDVCLMLHSEQDAVVNIINAKLHIAILDINLAGGKEGLEIGFELLKLKNIMIMYATAYTEYTKHIDPYPNNTPVDYIIKPFTEQEFSIALIALRKKYMEMFFSAYAKDIRLGEDCLFSAMNGCIISSKGKQFLTPSETKALSLLCSNLDSVVSHQVLVREVWDEKPINESTVRELIYRIRKKVPCLNLSSISKVGYMASGHKDTDIEI